MRTKSDLDKNQAAAVAHDQIDFAEPAAKISGQPGKPSAAQVSLRSSFCVAA